MAASCVFHAWAATAAPPAAPLIEGQDSRALHILLCMALTLLLRLLQTCMIVQSHHGAADIALPVKSFNAGGASMQVR